MKKNKPALLRQFHKLPISRQLLMLMALFLLLISMLGYGMVTRVQELLTYNASNTADMIASRYRNELEHLCSELNLICDDLQSDEDCRMLLSIASYRELAPELSDSVHRTSSMLMNANTHIVDVAFYNSLIHYSSLFSEAELSAIYERSHLSENVANHGAGLVTRNSQNYFIYCGGCYEHGTLLGGIFLTVDLTLLTEDLPAGQNAAFYLMDPDHTICGLNPEALRYTPAIPGYVEDYLAHAGAGKGAATGQYVFTENGEELAHTAFTRNSFSIRMDYLQPAGCYLISAAYIPSVNRPITRFSNQIIMLLIAILVFFFLLIGLLYLNMVRPLRKFSDTIENIRDEELRHLEEPIDITGCREVETLGDTFSEMFNSIEDLNHRIFETSSRLYEEKIRGQNAEISYYRSQINPHFLYNVLELIRSLALADNIPEIADIAVSLGKMYRYSTKGAPIIPLLDELNMSKAYVSIQKYRFRDRFEVIYNIPESLYNIPVMKIMLQPIIENALLHGIEPSLKPSILYIGAVKENGDLIIEVRDDGVGIPPDKLAQIRAVLKDERYDPNTYVGIYNTNARLRLQYGPEYGVEIDSVEGDGTVVRLRMPGDIKGDIGK